MLNNDENRIEFHLPPLWSFVSKKVNEAHRDIPVCLRQKCLCKQGKQLDNHLKIRYIKIS
jgi:hypothetical protein